MWAHLYKRTMNVVQKHSELEAKKSVQKSPKKDQTYNLYGFVWPLKVRFYL